MTATSILICVVVLNLHHRDPNAPVPHWLYKLTYNIMAPLVCMRGHTNRGQSVYQLCEFTREYMVGHFSQENQTESDSLNTPVDENGLCEQVCYLMKSGKKKILLEEVVKHLRTITAKLKEMDEQENLKTQWKVVAKILDRFFLVVFIIIVIVSSTTLLLIYPLLAQNRHKPDH